MKKGGYAHTERLYYITVVDSHWHMSESAFGKAFLEMNEAVKGKTSFVYSDLVWSFFQVVP